MREAAWLVLYAAHGMAARWLNIKLCRYIQWELAKPMNGGLDLQSRFRFYPDLPRERCLNLSADFPGAWTCSRHMTVLMWVLAAAFGPIWDMLLLIHLTAVGEWLTDRPQKGAWRDA